MEIFVSANAPPDLTTACMGSSTTTLQHPPSKSSIFSNSTQSQCCYPLLQLLCPATPSANPPASHRTPAILPSTLHEHTLRNKQQGELDRYNSGWEWCRQSLYTPSNTPYHWGCTNSHISWVRRTECRLKTGRKQSFMRAWEQYIRLPWGGMSIWLSFSCECRSLQHLA